MELRELRVKDHHTQTQENLASNHAGVAGAARAAAVIDQDAECDCEKHGPEHDEWF